MARSAKLDRRRRVKEMSSAALDMAAQHTTPQGPTPLVAAPVPPLPSTPLGSLPSTPLMAQALPLIRASRHPSPSPGGTLRDLGQRAEEVKRRVGTEEQRRMAASCLNSARSAQELHEALQRARRVGGLEEEAGAARRRLEALKVHAHPSINLGRSLPPPGSPSSASASPLGLRSLSPRSVTRAARISASEQTRRTERLQQVFRSFDLDTSGMMSTDELFAVGCARRKCMHKASEWSEAKNESMMMKMDQGANGEVSEVDFIRYFQTSDGALSRETDEFDAACDEFLEAAAYLRKLRVGPGVRVLDQHLTVRDLVKVSVLVTLFLYLMQLCNSGKRLS